jgi:tetratricopeptide (TPR) repeat protein
VTATDEFNAAVELHRAGRLNDAAEQYERVYQADPAFRSSYIRVLGGLARDFGRAHDFASALDAYERYLELKEPVGSDWLAYADLLLLARKSDEAATAVANAMAAGHDSAATQLIAARCARLSGDYEKARVHLREAIARRPAFGDAWQLLLDIEDRDALPQLAADCERLAADEGNSQRDRILMAMTAGRAFEKTGEYERAFAQYLAGNEWQRADQVARGLAYNRDETLELAVRAKRVFDSALQHNEPGDAAAQPVFIVGMPRSGTTLVERIIGGLPGVGVGGESESMGYVATQYYHDLEQGRVGAPAELAAADWSRLAEDYWRRERREPCRRTDKMPHNFWHVGLACGMFAAAPVIYLRRDPRDVCLSIWSRKFSDAHPYATRFDDLAHYYSQSVDLMSHWQRQYPGRILEVEFEGLLDEPESCSRRIAEHCGLEWTPGCLDFHERVATSFTYSEMQVREPLNRKGVGAWRRYERQLTPLLEALDEYDLLPPA